jgi:NhaP-type Na+/H+ or K+/H+ antiporter
MQLTWDFSNDEVGIIILFYLFFILSLNGLMSYVVSLMPDEYFMKQIPYVVYVFILGLLLGLISSFASGEDTKNVIQIATEFWDDFPPELMLYLFLPILIYREVVNLNTHHFLSTLGQGLVLAGPCAIAGTLVMAVLIDNSLLPFPVDWGTNGIYLFCSTLAATDSVSVISLLSRFELFRSQVSTLNIFLYPAESKATLSTELGPVTPVDKTSVIARRVLIT